MARGKKARQFTHLVCPTTPVAHKKRAAAEVRDFNNQGEVIFVGKSRHECFKWCHDQKTDDNYVKVCFIRTSYAEFLAGGSVIPNAVANVAAITVDDDDDGGVPADIACDADNLQGIADLLGD